MLHMTNAAGAHLESMLTDERAPEGVAIRLALNEATIEFELDRERPGDVVLTHGNRAVLLLNPQMAELVDENTLAVEDNEDGSKLALI